MQHAPALKSEVIRQLSRHASACRAASVGRAATGRHVNLAVRGSRPAPEWSPARRAFGYAISDARHILSISLIACRGFLQRQLLKCSHGQDYGRFERFAARLHKSLRGRRRTPRRRHIAAIWFGRWRRQSVDDDQGVNVPGYEPVLLCPQRPHSVERRRASAPRRRPVRKTGRFDAIGIGSHSVGTTCGRKSSVRRSPAGEFAVTRIGRHLPRRIAMEETPNASDLLVIPGADITPHHVRGRRTPHRRATTSGSSSAPISLRSTSKAIRRQGAQHRVRPVVKTLTLPDRHGLSTRPRATTDQVGCLGSRQSRRVVTTCSEALRGPTISTDSIIAHSWKTLVLREELGRVARTLKANDIAMMLDGTRQLRTPARKQMACRTRTRHPATLGTRTKWRIRGRAIASLGAPNRSMPPRADQALAQA